MKVHLDAVNAGNFQQKPAVKKLPDSVFIRVLQTQAKGEFSLIEAMGRRFLVKPPEGLFRNGLILKAKPQWISGKLVFQVDASAGRAAHSSRAFQWIDKFMSDGIMPSLESSHSVQNSVFRDMFLDRIAQILGDLVKSGLSGQIDHISQDESGRHQAAGHFSCEPYMFIMRFDTQQYGTVGLLMISETKSFESMEVQVFIKNSQAAAGIAEVFAANEKDLLAVGIEQITVKERPDSAGIQFEA